MDAMNLPCTLLSPAVPPLDIVQAGSYLLALLHRPKRVISPFVLPEDALQTPQGIWSRVISALVAAEGVAGLSESLLLFDNALFYRMLRDGVAATPVTSVQYNSQGGNTGAIFGHPFVAHPRVRANTLVVCGMRQDASVVVVASPVLWDETQLLFM